MNMQRQHVLLEKAETYKRPTGSLDPADCHYSMALGAWVVDATGEMLVRTPSRRRPRTKKQDVETGEDRKGE